MLIRNYLFHRVSDETDNEWPPMKPILFDRIIRFFKKEYNVINLEEFLENSAAFLKSSKPLATVLFDDGYKDNIDFAAPILQKHNCPASFYVVTNSITRNNPTWTFLLDHILQKTRTRDINLDLSIVPGEFKSINLSDKTKMSKVKPWMKTLSNTFRVQVLEEIKDQCPDVDIPYDKMMDWDDVRQLYKAGFSIGSHSHTHPILASLEDETEIEKELSISYEILTRELGKTPFTISYPNGGYDERVLRLSEKIGYKYGLAVETKFFRYGQDNLMAIPRVELYQEPWWKARLRMTSFYQSSKELWR